MKILIQAAIALSLLMFGLVFSLGAPGLSQPSPPRRFIAWCLNRNTLPEPTQHTVSVFLKQAGVSDCLLADHRLSQMKRLELYNLGVTDLGPLESLTHLTELTVVNLESPTYDVAENPYVIRDIRPLRSLTQLRKLNLGFNKIEDLSPLASMKRLEELNLQHNAITDLSPLASLTNLKSLDLNHNQIQDVMSLITLPQLRILGLRHNLITQVEPLQPLKDLAVIDLGGNPIPEEGKL